MRTSWTDTDRWNWYAAGDETIVPHVKAASAEINSTERVSFEIGLLFLVPLALAVFACLALPV